ncbi:MAG: corrinoid protein [Dysgonamonadaceae bacterium]|jgi:5-methyltetrahydrofolate--homocysteine methyltransferase|nr:corrinoid protein [Dysgonamonadaceae bacterium]
MNEELLSKLSELTEAGKINKALAKGQDGVDEVTKQALDEGVAPDAVLEALVKGMSAIGEKFAQGKAFVPNMLLAARAMNAGMAHLKPFFSSGQVKRKGTFIIGTVFGDLHDIGKNLVAMMVEGSGWEVIDLGVDVKPEKFINAVSQHPGCVVGLSALLTTTMGNMEVVLKSLREKYPTLKIIIGGAPISQNFAETIGANGFATNPQGAVELLNELVA